MRILLLLLGLLMAVPVWSGTWQDDFEDGDLNGWTKSGNAQWTVVDGRCKVSIVGGQDLAVFLIVGEPEWRDYSVEMECESSQASAWIGLSVRLQDSQNTHSWAVDCTDRTVHWITTVNNQPNIITGNPVAGNLVAEKHKLKVVVKGNEFQGYYDEKHVRTVQLGSFETGKVAILFRTWSSPASAFFDNVVIMGDAVPDVGPSGPSEFTVAPKVRLATTWATIKQDR